MVAAMPADKMSGQSPCLSPSHGRINIPATTNHSNTMNANHVQWERLTVTATAVATDCTKMKTVHFRELHNSLLFWPAWRAHQV